MELVRNFLMKLSFIGKCQFAGLKYFIKSIADLTKLSPKHKHISIGNLLVFHSPQLSDREPASLQSPVLRASRLKASLEVKSLVYLNPGQSTWPGVQPWASQQVLREIGFLVDFTQQLLVLRRKFHFENTMCSVFLNLIFFFQFLISARKLKKISVKTKLIFSSEYLGLP